MSNQIYIVTFTNTQLTQASFLQKNQMLQNGFLISVTLKTLIFATEALCHLIVTTIKKTF